MFKFVLFDLDDTILDFHKAEAQAIRKTFSQLGIEPSDENVNKYSAINESLWKRLERAEITREQLLSMRFEQLFEELGVNASIQTARTTYETLLGQGHFFMPGAEEILVKLAKDYQLYLVSNGTTKIQEGRIASAGIAQYFKEIFISQNIGINKPDKGFFDACFAEIPNFDPEYAIIVGDSLSSDIQGGINAGIHTCWYNPKKKDLENGCRPEWMIEDLQELSGILKL
ncbi:MAG: YjjG family noncanonical pyrimidine nucleotidase [Lachnospiraceae bacterium]|nr:YjjG family noncanonical pyrimidine nucleotidase [Lachnospiraceae bacterium]